MSKLVFYIFELPSRIALGISCALFLGRRRKTFDVLHIHEAHWLSAFGVWIGRWLNKPVIVKEASAPALSTMDRRMPCQKLLRRAVLKADRFVALSESVASSFEEQGVPRERTIIGRNGIPIPTVSAVGSLACGRSPIVVHIGNLTQHPLKGLDVLLAAWPAVMAVFPEARLEIAGKGNPEPFLSMARREGVDGSVRFLGLVSDISSLLRKADVFVLPSRTEGTSNALLEAMAHGLPCVVSDIPGNRRLVRHGDTGLLVRVEDPEALSQAIVRLLTEEKLRRRMGAQGRKFAINEYGMERVAEEYISLYRMLLNA